MAFAAALEQATDPRRKRAHVCRVVEIRNELSPSDAAALTEAMENHRVQGTAIAEALASEGHKIGAQSIQRHRNGRCLCESV